METGQSYDSFMVKCFYLESPLISGTYVTIGDYVLTPAASTNSFCGMHYISKKIYGSVNSDTDLHFKGNRKSFMN